MPDPQERGGATGELETVRKRIIDLLGPLDAEPFLRLLAAQERTLDAAESLRAQLAERDARIAELEAIVARETNETDAMFRMGEERRRLLAQVTAFRTALEAIASHMVGGRQCPAECVRMRNIARAALDQAQPPQQETAPET